MCVGTRTDVSGPQPLGFCVGTAEGGRSGEHLYPLTAVPSVLRAAAAPPSPISL